MEREPQFDDNWNTMQKMFGEHYLGIPFLMICIAVAYWLLT